MTGENVSAIRNGHGSPGVAFAGVAGLERIARAVVDRTAHIRAAAERAEGVRDWIKCLDKGDVELTEDERAALTAFALMAAVSAERIVVSANEVATSLQRRSV